MGRHPLPANTWGQSQHQTYCKYLYTTMCGGMGCSQTCLERPPLLHGKWGHNRQVALLVSHQTGKSGKTWKNIVVSQSHGELGNFFVSSKVREIFFKWNFLNVISSEKCCDYHFFLSNIKDIIAAMVLLLAVKCLTLSELDIYMPVFIVNDSDAPGKTSHKML